MEKVLNFLVNFSGLFLLLFIIAMIFSFGGLFFGVVDLLASEKEDVKERRKAKWTIIISLIILIACMICAYYSFMLMTVAIVGNM